MPINWPNVDQVNDPFADWNTRFAIPGVLAMVPGQGGLAKLLIDAGVATAELYLQGAQVTSWHPAGSEEVLFLSAQSTWAAGKAIRGGIPICFPWFRAKADDAKAPAHGFARTTEWPVVATAHDQDSVVVSLSLPSAEATERWWPHAFVAELKLSVGKTLSLALTIHNPGEEAFRFEEALHTYHRVGDVEAITVLGLDGVAYLDNRDGNQAKVQRGDFQFVAAADNAYVSAASPLVIEDEGNHRRIEIAKHNSETTVVWNPWQEAAATMADLGDHEWREFACVEAANILDAAVLLMPGETHTLTIDISVTPLA